ncbi:alpha/beta hydrolase [Niveibacterium sp. SC-1]|uniref:RBBP9/YdeN family alpha/beta hydrolase n=1 Tax=Niveibacterium sp. SC-1 TaxID=3135646 RepID=UPI00311F9648
MTTTEQGLRNSLIAASDLAESRQRFVLVPGLFDSGSTHWQSAWHERFPQWKRVTQRDWNTPDLDAWIAAIERTLSQQKAPVILVAHSFGALAASVVAAHNPDAVAGLFLVAPADPVKFGLEHRVPQGAIQVPSTLVASRNDRWLRYEWAAIYAARWGARLFDLGLAGHINAESGYGPWPDGLPILNELAVRVEALADQLSGESARRPPRTAGQLPFAIAA